MNTLAWIVIVVTSTAGDIPAGTEWVLSQPQECSVMTLEIAMIEALGGKADGFCVYTNAQRVHCDPERGEINKLSKTQKNFLRAGPEGPKQ